MLNNISQAQNQVIYPWQTAQWLQLWCSRQASRLPHALLFAGIPGIGKRAFTEIFARALLCSAVESSLRGAFFATRQSMDHHESIASLENMLMPESFPCGQCASCHLTLAKSHPDLLWIEPAKPGHAIKIDQIRDMIEFANKTALQGKQRVVVIHPATNMNINAANALLKILEEPSPHTFIILISDQDKELPATIVSRCQQVKFTKPDNAAAMAWLAPQIPAPNDAQLLLNIAHGAPLQALKYIHDDLLTMRVEFFQALAAMQNGQGDPLKYAAQWQELDSICLLDFLYSYLLDLLRLQQIADNSIILNTDQRQELLSLAQKIVSNKILDYIDYIQQIRRYVLMSVNLNKQLLLEDIFIRWVKLI